MGLPSGPLHRSVLGMLRVAVAASLLLAPRLGVAEPKAHETKAIASARSLFYRALALQDQGKWAEALELLEKVAETRESAQVRFNIAFNQEHLGRLASAARGYERAIALSGNGAGNVARAAHERLQGLSPRIARLLLRPAGDGIALYIDGIEVAPADRGRAVPVEVGDHTIRAEATGHEPYRTSLNLAGGEARELRIELQPIRAERPVETPPLVLPSKVSPRFAPPRPRPSPPRKPHESKPNALPYVAGGAALLSIATAGVFYALRQDALDTMHAGCRDARCPDELRSTDENGSLYTSIANVALATGVGFAGVSAGLFISDFSSADEARGATAVRASVSTRF